MPRSKDRLPLKELSKIVLVGLDQQTPTLSTIFFNKCVVFNYQSGWPSSAATWFEWGGLCTKSRMFGKSCEVKGQVSGAPYDIQEPSSKLDN